MDLKRLAALLALLLFLPGCTKTKSVETAACSDGIEPTAYMALTFDDGPSPLYTEEILGILGEYGVVVYPRKGYDLNMIREKLYSEMEQTPAPYVLDISAVHTTPGTLSLMERESLYNIQIVDAPIVDISSTQIRDALARGEDMSEWMM